MNSTHRYRNEQTLNLIDISQTATIFAKRTVAVQVGTKSDYCKEDESSPSGERALVGTPAVTGNGDQGVFRINGFVASDNRYPGFADNGDGSGRFNTGSVDPGQYTVEYIYTNAAGCISSTSTQITVHPSPTVNFLAGQQIIGEQACEGLPVAFEDISVAGAFDYIESRFWDFGSDVVTDSDTARVTNATFVNAATYPVELEVTSHFGCEASLTLDVIVEPTPAASFDFLEIREGNQTKFVRNSAVPAAGDSLVSWVFDGGAALDYYANFNDTVRVDLGATGWHDVELSVTSLNNCTTVLVDSMFKLPVIVASATDPSLNYESFATDAGWIADGDKLSWEWGTPSGTLINGTEDGNQAWVTNLDGAYNEGEVSYLYSPSYDLTALTRPMVGFKSFVSTPVKLDGVVMEHYNHQSRSWEVLGGINEGKFWFNETQINSTPGENALGTRLDWYP